MVMTHDNHVNLFIWSMYATKKIQHNWFTGLGVTAKSWFMTLGSWEITHESWQPYKLFFGTMCTSKIQLNWFTGLNIIMMSFMEVELSKSDHRWMEGNKQTYLWNTVESVNLWNKKVFLVAQIIEEVSLNLDNAWILGLLSEPSLLLDL